MKSFFQLRESTLQEKTLELAGVTLQHMEHCPGAVAAFKRNLKDGASEADVAKAAKAVDNYLAIEDKAIKAGKATDDDVEEMEKRIDRAEKIIAQLGLEGHTYHDMHLDRVEDMVEDDDEDEDDEDEDEDEDDLDEQMSADRKPQNYRKPDGKMGVRMVPAVKEKTLTPAEKKKREEIAQAIKRDNPDMPMDKKMAIATATAKRVAEAAEDEEPASPDEKSMAIKQAEFIMYVGKEITDHLKNNKEFPEWMQNKLSALHQKAKDVHSTLGAHGDDMNEAAPKMKGDFFKQQRQKDAEHAKAMGVSVKTGRKLPKKTMTSTQRSLASMRNEEVNEISDKMKGRYIQKSMGDHQHANAVRKDAESRGNTDLAAKMRARMKKRNQGMTRAFGGERD